MLHMVLLASGMHYAHWHKCDALVPMGMPCVLVQVASYGEYFVDSLFVELGKKETRSLLLR
jgi:hypothetical protein